MLARNTAKAKRGILMEPWSQALGKMESWLKKVLTSTISREAFAREVIYDYPITVLREAIINAIVHRDYDIEGAKIYLNIDDEKIVVKSK